MATPTTTLSTNRYVPPGTYINQIITPSPAVVTSDLLVSAYIGKGSRLIMGRNIGIRRSYVYSEQLVFSPSAPYRAILDYYSDGNKDMAVLTKADGTEVRSDQWTFYKSLGTYYDTVEINVEVFDATTTYYIDYQSTQRDVKDPLPIEDIREVVTMGDNFDTSQYREYTHYYIETSISGPSASAGTPHLGTKLISNVHAGSAINATATGCIFWTCSSVTGSAYTGDYLRNYSIFPYYSTSSAGVTGVVFRIVNNYVEPGTAAYPAYEVNHDNTLFVDVTTAGTYNIDLGLGLYLRGTVTALGVTTAGAFNFSSAANEGWHLNAVGTAKMEIDPLLTNTNQFAEIGSISHTVTGARVTATSNPGLTVLATSSYTGSSNARYYLKCVSTSGTNPLGIRRAAFLWGAIGAEDYFTNTAIATTLSGVSTATVTLNAGISLTVNFGTATGNFYSFNPAAPLSGASDQFYFEANAPRSFYRGKDDRDITLTVTNKNAFIGTGISGNGYASGHVVGTLLGTYNANTPEGGYASFSTALDIDSVSGVNVGSVLLKDNLKIYFRNMVWDSTAITEDPFASNPVSRFSDSTSTSDVWTFTIVNQDYIVWDLNAYKTENINTSNIVTDVLGQITGTPNTKYIILDDIPVSASGITIVDSTSPTAKVVSGWTFLSNTNYIYFASDPTTSAAGYTFPLAVKYLYRSAEPSPGDLYYMTASYIRSEDYYNNPILVQSRQAARDLLSPASIVNDVYVMSEIAWDNNVPEFYVIQVKDSDEDGVYTDLDFKTAIVSAEGPERIADIIVLNKWTSLANTLKHLDKMADPFVRRHRIGWFGVPQGTAIGNRETSGSIVYAARNTMQVYGDSPAHGTRILIGSTIAKTNIQLENGVSAEVTMDGSFVAGAIAAINRAFTSYSNTVLRKTIAGFTYIETYGDVETTSNKTLGESNVIYITDRGNSVYRIEEDFTVDNFAQDYNLIMHMTQKQYVTRYVYKRMDESLISLVVPSPEATLALVRGFLVSILNSLVGSNVIAKYQDSEGNVRAIDPDTDIKVFIDSNDSTKIHFIYTYYLPQIIKRLFGLYTVNQALPF